MNNPGVVGGGHLGEQIKLAVKTADTTNAIPPADNSGTITGAALDRRGFNAALVVINVGAVTASGAYTVKVQDSPDNSTWTDLGATEVQFGAVTTDAGAVATANTDVAYAVDLRRADRYIRLVGTKTAGTSVIWGAVVVLGAADAVPAALNS